jgi:hypothetical protein
MKHVASAAVLAIFILLAFGSSSPQSSETLPPPVDDATCRKTLSCWADRHLIAASVRCADNVERLARFQSEWTGSSWLPKFTAFRWKDSGSGTVTYVGDQVKFQNGFGAWQNMVYECDFDPETKTVLAVRAKPGRLPAR